MRPPGPAPSRIRIESASSSSLHVAPWVQDHAHVTSCSIDSFRRANKDEIVGTDEADRRLPGKGAVFPQMRAGRQIAQLPGDAQIPAPGAGRRFREPQLDAAQLLTD